MKQARKASQRASSGTPDTGTDLAVAARLLQELHRQPVCCWQSLPAGVLDPCDSTTDDLGPSCLKHAEGGAHLAKHLHAATAQPRTCSSSGSSLDLHHLVASLVQIEKYREVQDKFVTKPVASKDSMQQLGSKRWSTGSGVELHH